MAKFNMYTEYIDLTAVKNFCRDKGNVAIYPKNSTFVEQGKVGKYIGLLEYGYVKYSTITTDGEEAVVGFAFAGELVADFYNSFNDIPSLVTIKAGNKSKIYQIPISEAKPYLNSVFDNNISQISEALFREIYKRLLELYQKTPTERYLDLINNNPDIFNIVSMRDIASYLNISPIYLSRIRKKLR